MARLTIEVSHRHQHQFYKVEKPVVRIGRALDNDIILPDPAVSPHHLLIRTTPAGGHEVVSLAAENGTRFNRGRIDGTVAIDRLPLRLDAGRTRIVVHDQDQPVAATRKIGCRSGGLCLFGNWLPAVMLFGLMILFSAYENYLSTPKQLTWDTFWSDQLVVVAVALGLTVGMCLVNRVTAYRWEFASCLSFVSLALLLSFAIDQLSALLNYYFTSPAPGFLINLGWVALVLPWFMGWFLTRLHHGHAVTSWILVIVILSPSVYLQIQQVSDYYDLTGEFSNKSHYSTALYPLDIRRERNMTISDFITDAPTLIAPHDIGARSDQK